jgi:flavorubredoxin
MRTINLGGTTLELIYLGRNHSNGNLVMRLPKERIIFTVDWIPLQSLPFRGMADT